MSGTAALRSSPHDPKSRGSTSRAVLQCLECILPRQDAQCNLADKCAKRGELPTSPPTLSFDSRGRLLASRQGCFLLPRRDAQCNFTPQKNKIKEEREEDSPGTLSLVSEMAKWGRGPGSNLCVGVSRGEMFALPVPSSCCGQCLLPRGCNRGAFSCRGRTLNVTCQKNK